MTFDVAVIGGGPAGIAIAATLHRRGRRVVVFERTGYEEPRAGETFGAELGPLLRTLGAWEAIAEVLGAQVPCVAVSSAWGSDELVERSAMLHPLGPGWHVDRARFDAALAGWARSIGVDVRTLAGTCRTVRDDVTSVVPRRGDPVTARFVVEASGRGASGRWVAYDRQIAMIARMRGAAGSELLVEASADGWWYAASQPNGELVVVYLTDSDLVRPRESSFAAALARTTHIAARVGELAGPVRVVRADTGRSQPDGGNDWCAAGDAALARDPLAGDGVCHAIRDALELADPIERALDRGEPVVHPGRDRRFRDYLDRRDIYYGAETRWPDAPFWVRRRSGAWQDAPLTLHPETVLARGGSPDLAAVEALLPPHAIEAALAALATPLPAHAIMTALRASAPIGDRRLLVGLQRLVERGAIVVAQ